MTTSHKRAILLHEHIAFEGQGGLSTTSRDSQTGSAGDGRSSSSNGMGSAETYSSGGTPAHLYTESQRETITINQTPTRTTASFKTHQMATRSALPEA